MSRKFEFEVSGEERDVYGSIRAILDSFEASGRDLYGMKITLVPEDNDTVSGGSELDAVRPDEEPVPRETELSPDSQRAEILKTIVNSDGGLTSLDIKSNFSGSPEAVSSRLRELYGDGFLTREQVDDWDSRGRKPYRYWPTDKGMREANALAWNSKESSVEWATST